MNETTIRKLAAQFGLTVNKRITTGNPQAGFATFELTGTVKSVASGWLEIAAACRLAGLHRDFYYLRHSDADRSLYIGIESVWTTEETAS